MTNEFENLNEKTTSDNTNSTVDNTTENTADVTPIENENNQETELFENTNNVTNDNILDTDDTNNEADVQNDILNSDNSTAEDETFTSDNAPKEPKYSYKKGIALGLAGVLLCGGSLGFCLGLGLNTSKAITNAITGGFSFSNSSESKTTSAQATA